MVGLRRDHAREVRYALADPHKLCSALGLSKGAKRQSSGLTVCCPVHGDRTPSCSVTVGPDGTVRVRCFSCDFSGDALTLLAAVSGLSPRSQFREVLALGADLAGALQLRDEILAGSAMPERPRFEAPARRAAVTYPPAADIEALWSRSGPVAGDADAWEYLRGRGIDPESLDRAGAFRVMPEGLKTPRWARYGGKTWHDTGHRLVVAMVDVLGRLRSVRGWRIVGGDSPKRLPPGGHRATGLVMANREAVQMLRRRYCPLWLTIVEGEPDFASAVVSWAGEAVIGIVSGSWSEDFANAVPAGTEVVIATHHDSAGERYAEHVASTLAKNPLSRMAA